MSAVTRPRGPLPVRVYWTRRLLLVAVSFVLVFGLARLLDGGGNGAGPSAQPVGADASRSSGAAATSSTATAPPTEVHAAPTIDADPSASATRKKGGESATPLPVADGPCSASDLVVTPTIKHHAYAGRPVVFAMQLSAKSSPACDFTVSARTLVLKVSSGSDRVWSTQQCHGAIPKQAVVVRKDTPAVVDMAWNGQRSDADCSDSTTWAEPGYYHAAAAAYGSDPVDAQFKLEKPARPTETAKPSPKDTASPTAKSTPKPTSSPAAKKKHGTRHQR